MTCYLPLPELGFIPKLGMHIADKHTLCFQ
jgi:hypothetical protein